MPIKLFHIQLLPIMSGVQKAMVDLITRLDRKKFEITVICKEEGELTDILTEWNIQFITVPSLVRNVNPLKDFSALKDITRILKEKKPDIVHTHSSKSGVIGRIAASHAGIPVIFHTIHGFSFHEFSSLTAKTIFIPIERLVSKYTDLHISVNQYDMDYAVKHKIIKKNKIIKVYNGIAPEENKRIPNLSGFKENLHIPADGLVVTQVGRLWRQKAPEVFVRTAIKILEHRKDVYFLLIGDGELRSKLERMITARRCEKNIKILGWRNDVDKILSITDVFMLTSLWEGLSIAILEAMVRKLPVVVSDIKGNRELVIENETGFLCKPNTPDAFYEKLSQLLESPAQRQKLGHLGYDRAQNDFSIKKTVSTLDKLYHGYFSKSAKEVKITGR